MAAPSWSSPSVMTMMALPTFLFSVKLRADRLMAAARSVPWFLIIDGSISPRNIFAETKSLVIGSCTKASPAKTTSPILSSTNVSTSRSTIIFARCRRSGVTSLARMELLTSSAMMVSMPARFSSLMRLPNCGRASITIKSASTPSSNQNFTDGRQRETSGIRASTKAGSPKRRRRCFLLRCMTKRTMASTMTTDRK